MDTEKKNEIPVIAIYGEDMGVRTREGGCATVCCCSNGHLSHAAALVCVKDSIIDYVRVCMF